MSQLPCPTCGGPLIDTDAGRAWLHARDMAKTADRERMRADTAERERDEAREDKVAYVVRVNELAAENAQLRERAEAAERELAEVGVRGSPPPEGSYIQRLEARVATAERELKAAFDTFDTDAGRAWLRARSMAKTADRERVRAETAEWELEAERQRRRQALDDIEARDASVERAMAEAAQLRERLEAVERERDEAKSAADWARGRAAALAAKESSRA